MHDIEPEKLLRDLFLKAVSAADPMTNVPAALPRKPKGRVVVVGAGKASARMAEAVEKTWGPCEGIVITRYGYARNCKSIGIIEAAHPVPDQRGADATIAIMELLNSLTKDDFVLSLISGGGSALLVSPGGNISLAQKQQINADLLSSGAPIDEMNIVRKHISGVKGGQMAAAAFPASMLTLIISDVPGDDPASIASGPTVGDISEPKQALAILKKYQIDVPDAVACVLTSQTGVLRPDDKILSKAENLIIAAPAQSLLAAAEIARENGIEVRMLGDALEGEALELGGKQAKMALDIQRKMRIGQAPVLLLSGGECTVTLRGTGTGGPNAEFMLAAAIELNGADNIYAIACDTDGVDGAQEIAGAVIGPATLSKARSKALDPCAFLANHDSHSFFAAIDDQVITGPTLTNVNDFRAFLILPREQS